MLRNGGTQLKQDKKLHRQRQRKRNRSPASFLDKERKAGSRPWQYCLRVYDLILILYPREVREVKLPVVEGIELQAVGTEAKSVAVCSLPGSKLLASLSRNLYCIVIFL